tara:strand:- start:1973 stop:2680 length:708 start_codon:yes stop_codon:yes gene_type:complete
MIYYTSAPVPANQVPAEIMGGIKRLHGSYDNYNAKLRQTVNTQEQMKAFESVITEDFMWSLYDTNITLYSSSKAAEIMSGIKTPMAIADVAAAATKVNGVIYIAIDVDPIIDAIEKEGGVTYRLSQLVESIVEHEMVHVLQMERGDLDMVPDGIIWKGRKYDLQWLTEQNEKAAKSSNEFAGIMNQLLLPWELEAYAVSLMDKNLEELYTGDLLKIMQRARKQYLSGVSNRSRPA